MTEFDDIQERLEGSIASVAELLNKHGSAPCTAAEISSVLLAKEINYLTLSVNRQAVALDKIAEQLEALVEPFRNIQIMQQPSPSKH